MYDRRWINKFIKLCSKGNNKDYSKAMKLKNGKMPPKLYQYRSIVIESEKDRLQWLCDVLEKGQVFCSTRSGLNDPLDIRSILSNNTASPYYNIVPMYTATKFFKPLIKMWFKRNSVPEKDIRWFDSEFENEFMRSVEEAHSLHDDFLEALKIVCFTETYKNLPMWWFYADERRGVCLEFDTNRINRGEKLFIFPIKYTDILPDTLKDFPNIRADWDTRADSKKTVFHLLLRTGILPCTHKLSDWSYEREWRYIMLNANYFNVGIPSKIILGDKIDSDKEDRICAVAHKNKIIVSKILMTRNGFSEDIIQN